MRPITPVPGYKYTGTKSDTNLSLTASYFKTMNGHGRTNPWDLCMPGRLSQVRWLGVPGAKPPIKSILERQVQCTMIPQYKFRRKWTALNIPPFSTTENVYHINRSHEIFHYLDRCLSRSCFAGACHTDSARRACRHLPLYVCSISWLLKTVWPELTNAGGYGTVCPLS